MEPAGFEHEGVAKLAAGRSSLRRVTNASKRGHRHPILGEVLLLQQLVLRMPPPSFNIAPAAVPLRQPYRKLSQK